MQISRPSSRPARLSWGHVGLHAVCGPEQMPTDERSLGSKPFINSEEENFKI